MNLSDLKDLKAEADAIKAHVRKAQTWVQNLADSVKDLFKSHKTEMIVVSVLSLVIGAKLF